MNDQSWLLVVTAISIGFFHTLLGPDHYLPFIVMNKSGKWSMQKTFWVTILSGLGHVGSSVVIGFIGIALGIAISKLQLLESVRGSIAAWLFIAFGFFYTIWGLKHALKSKKHSHFHYHPDGQAHTHHHSHLSNHIHVHDHHENKNLTPWIIFTIFVLGPCEPLIPILMYPAVNQSYALLIFVTLAFSLVTIITMTGIVFLGINGLNKLSLKKLERFSHAIAGFTILMSGIAIEFMGL
ncbi:MAG: sulfite exporter TauE/SafE family protein [Bacteroidales bacterium]